MDVQNFETLKNKSKRGGARKNAGRHKGGMNPQTLEKERTLRELKSRIAQSADVLLNAQLSVALGSTFLFCKRTVGKGKNKKTVVEIVDDIETIKSYFQGELDGLEDEYYYMTTSKPDSRAIDSMFDRAFGKAKETLEIDPKAPLTSITVEYIDTRNEPQTASD